jgi:hypothetical protein
MKSAALRMLLTTTMLGGALFACDEVYADPVTVPRPSFGSVPDSGLTSTRKPPAACPRNPRENGPCNAPESVCEVGTSLDPKCNATFVCTADDLTLQSYWTERSPSSCTGVCPAPSQIVDGAPCETGDAGEGAAAELHCATPIGNCACTTGRDGAHAHERKWVCTKPEVGCPETRPLHGQPCSGERACDYGSCTSKRGSRMICEDDVWQVEVGPCE